MPEGNILNCPTCGAALALADARAELKCPYCGNTVIVPPELRPLETAGAQGVNPIRIVMNESGTSIQVADLSAFQPPPVQLVLGESGFPVSPAVSVSTNRWFRNGMWAFVIFMIAVAVIPAVCALCGAFGGLAGAFAPFVVK